MTKDSSDVVLILGIPIDDLTLESAVQRILALADSFRQDGRPRQVATVNVDFLTNALAWTVYGAPRHPELLDILRRSDLVTADGMPLVWLARLLGKPLAHRVTGADLVPALAASMSQSGHRLYFLGGQGNVAELAAQRLQADYPGLQIVGVHAPFVHTQGPELLEAEDADSEILSLINAVKPDVLLVGFGNPKQELWFHRNRDRLKAGVTIGVGGTFEFIVGRVARAPRWMQRSGLEWVFRITQDPARLWKRYAVGFAKLTFMALPMVIHYRWLKWRHGRHPVLVSTANLVPTTNLAPTANAHFPANNRVENPDLALTPPSSPPSPPEVSIQRTGFTLVLPQQADALWVRQQHSSPTKPDTPGTPWVIDFSATRFIDSSALGYLVRQWKAAQAHGWNTQITGLNNPAVTSLLRMTRILDLFTEGGSKPAAPYVFEPSAPYPIQANILLRTLSDNTVLLALNGRLDAEQMAIIDFPDLARNFSHQDVLVDLSSLNFVDSIGLRLFFKLQRYCAQQGTELVFFGLRPAVQQLLEITRLTQLLTCVRDQPMAEQLLDKRRKQKSNQHTTYTYTAPNTTRLRFIRFIYLLAYHGEKTFNRLRRPNTRGAYVAIWWNERLLLIRNSYKACFTLPCGGVRKHEAPILAAQREVLEEIGLQIPEEQLQLIGEYHLDAENKRDHVYLFSAQLPAQPELLLDGTEVVWAGFLPKEECMALPLCPLVQEYLKSLS